LPSKDIQIGIDHVKGGRRRSGEVVGIGCADGIRICARIRIAGRIDERRVGSGDGAVIGIETQILIRVTNDANTIRDGIEIETECRAAQRRIEYRGTDRRGSTVNGINRVETAGVDRLPDGNLFRRSFRLAAVR
jgi:hypothetical protein